MAKGRRFIVCAEIQTGATKRELAGLMFKVLRHTGSLEYPDILNLAVEEKPIAPKRIGKNNPRSRSKEK